MTPRAGTQRVHMRPNIHFDSHIPQTMQENGQEVDPNATLPNKID